MDNTERQNEKRTDTKSDEIITGENEQKAPAGKKENMLVNLLFNIVIPVILLSKFAKPDYLGEKAGLAIALAFPVLYFVYDWIQRRKVNAISILGFAGILVMGLIGLLELPREYVAYERAAVPLLIGLAVLISTKTSKPLIKKLIYNKEMLDTDRIDAELSKKGKTEEFDHILLISSYLVAASFVLSSVLNYLLTQHFMMDMTVDYNTALAKVISWSFPIIAVPCTVVMMAALWYIFKRLTIYTGLEMEELFAEQLRDKEKKE